MALRLLCFALGGVALAQGSSQVQGLLRNPSGDSVAAAVVQFVPDPVPAVLALTGATAPSATGAVESDARGVFRVTSQGPGTIFAYTAPGLGAVALDCQPGRAVRLDLAPMGELTAGGSEPILAWPAWIDAEGRRHHLPMQHGTAIRLPAGSYEIWCDLGFGIAWQRVTLRSGQRTLLQPAKESLSVAAPTGVQITPLAFPHAMLASATRPKVQLLGEARLATLAQHSSKPPLVLPFVGAELPSLPAPEDCLSVRVGQDVAGACAWLLDRADQELPRILAAAPADAAGVCALPKPARHESAWLLVTARDRAPHAERLSMATATREVALSVGRTVQCQVTAPSGLPAVGVAVDFVPKDAPLATLRARTDDRGIATMVHVHGNGELRIEAADLGTARRELGDESLVALTIDEGAVVEGSVIDAAGTPMVGVTVQLRDPGATASRERAMTTDASGRFRFVGLAEGQPVVLFAQQVRLGVTWSGRAELLAPRRSVAVVLSNEDPKLVPRTGRDR
jgi:hypothetical protein